MDTTTDTEGAEKVVYGCDDPKGANPGGCDDEKGLFSDQSEETTESGTYQDDTRPLENCGGSSERVTDVWDGKDNAKDEDAGGEADDKDRSADGGVDESDGQDGDGDGEDDADGDGGGWPVLASSKPAEDARQHAQERDGDPDQAVPKR